MLYRKRGQTMMKKLNYQWAVALIAVAIVSVALASSANAAGLLHRYSFDGDANDSVGTANGTLMNGAVVGSGTYGSALITNGNNGGIGSKWGGTGPYCAWIPVPWRASLAHSPLKDGFPALPVGPRMTPCLASLTTQRSPILGGASPTTSLGARLRMILGAALLSLSVVAVSLPRRWLGLAVERQSSGWTRLCGPRQRLALSIITDVRWFCVHDVC